MAVVELNAQAGSNVFRDRIAACDAVADHDAFDVDVDSSLLAIIVLCGGGKGEGGCQLGEEYDATD